MPSGIWCDSWDAVVQVQEQELMILEGPFQLSIFHDSMICAQSSFRKMLNYYYLNLKLLKHMHMHITVRLTEATKLLLAGGYSICVYQVKITVCVMCFKTYF